MGVQIQPNTHATAGGCPVLLDRPARLGYSVTDVQAGDAYGFHLTIWPAQHTPTITTYQHSHKLVLIGPIAPGWSLLQPLPITTEQDEGYWVISDDQFFVYGDGHTYQIALDDYILALIDYFQLLQTSVKKNPADRAPFRHLGQYLQPTPLH